MPKLKPFRVGDVVQWDSASAPDIGGWVDVNFTEATVKYIRRDKSSESGWVIDVEWNGKYLTGYDLGWFKKTKRTTLKTYFNV